MMVFVKSVGHVDSEAVCGKLAKNNNIIYIYLFHILSYFVH